MLPLQWFLCFLDSLLSALPCIVISYAFLVKRIQEDAMPGFLPMSTGIVFQQRVDRNRFGDNIYGASVSGVLFSSGDLAAPAGFEFRSTAGSAQGGLTPCEHLTIKAARLDDDSVVAKTYHSNAFGHKTEREFRAADYDTLLSEIGSAYPSYPGRTLNGSHDLPMLLSGATSVDFATRMAITPEASGLRNSLGTAARAEFSPAFNPPPAWKFASPKDGGPKVNYAVTKDAIYVVRTGGVDPKAPYQSKAEMLVFPGPKDGQWRPRDFQGDLTAKFGTPISFGTVPYDQEHRSGLSDLTAACMSLADQPQALREATLKLASELDGTPSYRGVSGGKHGFSANGQIVGFDANGTIIKDANGRTKAACSADGTAVVIDSEYAKRQTTVEAIARDGLSGPEVGSWLNVQPFRR